METIYSIIEEYFSLEHRGKWDYYLGRELEIYKNIESLFENPGTFIEWYLRRGEKEPPIELNQYLHDDDFKNRMSHVISTFFLGIILYDKLEYVKHNIDNYLRSLEILVMERGSRHRFVEIEFVYYWFLVCFYHDIGYVMTKRKKNFRMFDKTNWNEIQQEVVTILQELQTKGFGIPMNIRQCSIPYLEYRKGKSKENLDHGILSGTYYYHNRKEKFKQIFRDIPLSDDFYDGISKLHWSKHMLEIVHTTISWNIISHNIWFQKSTDRNPYPDYLKSLVVDYPKVSLNKNPLYFLLCFIDTFDIVKFFIKRNNKNLPQRILKLFRSVSFEPVSSGSFKMEFKNKEHRTKFLEKLKGEVWWLDFSVHEEGNGLIISFFGKFGRRTFGKYPYTYPVRHLTHSFYKGNSKGF